MCYVFARSAIPSLTQRQCRLSKWPCNVVYRQEAVEALVCGHVFHTECLNAHLDTAGLTRCTLPCPTCKIIAPHGEVTEDSDDNMLIPPNQSDTGAASSGYGSAGAPASAPLATGDAEVDAFLDSMADALYGEGVVGASSAPPPDVPVVSEQPTELAKRAAKAEAKAAAKAADKAAKAVAKAEAAAAKARAKSKAPPKKRPSAKAKAEPPCDVPALNPAPTAAEVATFFAAPALSTCSPPPVVAKSAAPRFHIDVTTRKRRALDGGDYGPHWESQMHAEMGAATLGTTNAATAAAAPGTDNVTFPLLATTPAFVAATNAAVVAAAAAKATATLPPTTKAAVKARAVAATPSVAMVAPSVATAAPVTGAIVVDGNGDAPAHPSELDRRTLKTYVWHTVVC